MTIDLVFNAFCALLIRWWNEAFFRQSIFLWSSGLSDRKSTLIFDFVLAFAFLLRISRIKMFTAMGHVGLIMIFSKLSILEWLKKAIAAVGKMALTNYLMHSFIWMFVFTGIGFGLFGKLERHQLYYVVFSICIFQLIISPICLTYFLFGPVEWLWRTLTYLKRQPMRKRTTSRRLSNEVLAA